MALEKALRIKGVEATYHRVTGLSVDTADRSNTVITVTIAFYADKSQRDEESTPTGNSLGTMRFDYSRGGITWQGDGIPYTELKDDQSRAAVESFIFAHLPETYGVLKLLPIYQDAKDA